MPSWLDDAIDIAKKIPAFGPTTGIWGPDYGDVVDRVKNSIFGADVTPERSKNFIKAIMAARKYGVPESVMVGVLSAEGSFWSDPDGNHGGIGQFTRDTAKDYGSTPEELAKNPDKAVDIVGQHLQKLGKYFNNDWEKATAAYYVGPGTIDAASKGAGGWLSNADRIAKENSYGPPVSEYLKKAGATPGTTGGTSLRNMSSDQIMSNMGLNKPTGSSLKNYNPAKLPTYNDFVTTSGNESYFDSDGFKAALDLHKQYMSDDQNAYARTVGPISQYVDDIVAEYAAQIEAGKLDTSKATNLFNARVKSMETAYKQYDSESFKYAAPAGKAYIPGREPGGMFEKWGLSPLPSDRSTTIDPLGDAARNYSQYESGLNSVRYPGVPDIANQRRSLIDAATRPQTPDYARYNQDPRAFQAPNPLPLNDPTVRAEQGRQQTLLEQLLAAGIGY